MTPSMPRTKPPASRWLRIVLAACLLILPMTAQAEPPRALTMDTWPQLQATLKDKPVIVHFWGVTCAICMAELPEWGTFAARHPHVRIVLVNWDRDANMPRIDATLGKAKLRDVENWMLGEDYEEKLRFAIDREWMGEMPRTRLVSLDGSVTSFSGAADFAKLTQWITTQRYAP